MSVKPVIHARDHRPGGADPQQLGLGVGWAGPTPSTSLVSSVWKIPKAQNVDLTFNISRIVFRLETPGTSSTEVQVEKSAGGNSAFSASTVGSVTLASGDYEGEVTTSLGTIASGDLLRIVFLSAASDAAQFMVELEAAQP